MPSGFPLASTVAQLVELERTSHRRNRPLADEDLARLGCLLEPRCHVDRVARDEGAADARLTRDDVSRIHADAQRERAAEELLQTPLHRERRMKRTLRMVLIGRGRSEGGHDGIADEFLDRATGISDLGRHSLVEPVEQGSRSLSVLGVRKLRRADEVGEKNRCKLPLLDGGPRRLFGECSAALQAELCALGVLGAAACAAGHEASLGHDTRLTGTRLSPPAGLHLDLTVGALAEAVARRAEATSATAGSHRASLPEVARPTQADPSWIARTASIVSASSGRLSGR